MTQVAVCFDLDDTLYPYAAYARAGLDAAADHLAERTGRQLRDELHRLYFEENVTTGTFDSLVSRYDDIPTSIVDDLVEAYHSSTAPLEPYQSTEPLIRGLANDGYRLGLVTDGRNGHEKLQRLEIADYFDATVVTPTLESSKHDREPFDRVLETLSVDPAETVYVGDDPRVDFTVPNHLGMNTVRIRRGRYTDLEPEDPGSVPDVEVDSLRTLPAILATRSLPSGVAEYTGGDCPEQRPPDSERFVPRTEETPPRR